MSTENDFRTPWDAERIANLRTLGRTAVEANGDNTDPFAAWTMWETATQPITVFSLLDELEMVRKERDEARKEANDWKDDYQRHVASAVERDKALIWRSRV